MRQADDCSGARFETMGADRFWLAHAIIVGVSGLILFALRGPVRRAFAQAAVESSYGRS